MHDACICYLLFFQQIIALQKLWKMLLVSAKKLFSFWRFQIFVFFFLSTFSKFIRTNESGIIYDVMN